MANRIRTCLQLIETGGPGGAERMLLQLVADLPRKGIRPIVVLLKPGWLHDQLLALGIDCHIVPWRGYLDIGWLRTVRGIVRSEDVDVIHSHEFFMNCIGPIVGRMTGVRSVATVHGKNYYGDKHRRRMAMRVSALLGNVVAVSADIESYLVSLGIPESSVFTIHNGIALEKFQFDDETRARARADAGIEPTGRLILAVGNLYPVKGHRHLIEALSLLVAAGETDAIVAIAGRGQLENELKTLAEELGVADSVRFLGFVEDIYPWLCACDLFAMPSLSEGIPLAVLEAMACGRTVIVSDVGGFREIIDDGRSGFLVPAGDSKRLAERLRPLLDQDYDPRAVQAEARRRIEREFSAEAMLNSYVAHYEGASGTS